MVAAMFLCSVNGVGIFESMIFLPFSIVERSPRTVEYILGNRGMIA